jgi:tetratricopeptide (TPR) repeat protein
MIRRHHPWRILVALVVFLPIEVAAQTRIEGVVAAQTITNSPITIGATPAEQQALVLIFSQQIAATSAERAKAEARAAELGTQLGFTQGAVISFFRIVGEQDVPLEHIGPKLGEIAAKHRTLMERWSVLDTADPATAALAAQAKAAIDGGLYDEADAMLLRARDQEIAAARQAEQLARDAQQAAERRWLRAAEADGKRGDLAMTRLKYVDAAQHYAAAASSVPAARQDERRQYLEKEADALYQQGFERGDNRAAAQAIDRHRALARATDRATMPLDWARTQTNLGNALATLGEREAETARLEEAVVAYRLALQEATRERVPLDWARTQMRLGNALQALGGREAGTGRLEEAVAAYRLALEEATREWVPLDWARTQMNLGNALATLGEREVGTARLEEAVAAYRLALEERTRERAPLAWATAQMNLGTALERLGERQVGTARLEEAVAVYRLALEEWTRERVPLDWAMAQMNLGNALQALGDRESGTARLEEAVTAYRLALEEWTRERVPLYWATTQMNLGNALQTLGEREPGTERLAEAVAAWDICLTVIETAWPQVWVQSVRNRRDQATAEITRRASAPVAANPQPPAPAAPK